MSLVEHTMLDKFFALELEIHKLFGYKEDWVKIPLADYRDQFWYLTGETNDAEVIHFDTPLTTELIEDEEYYTAQIYTQRFLPKWVYRSKKHTLICMNPGVDGNRFLGIFNNDKEQKEITE